MFYYTSKYMIFFLFFLKMTKFHGKILNNFVNGGFCAIARRAIVILPILCYLLENKEKIPLFQCVTILIQIIYSEYFKLT